MCDLSIVLLVWRDAEFLRPCLDSLVAARGDLDIEIILVQNGVTFDDLSLSLFGAGDLTHDVSRLTLHVIANAENRGVAPARNQGLAVARGRYLMLLDVDTLVTQDALANLVRFMDENGQVGLAGPRLQDANGNLQLTCRKLPTVWSKMLRRIPAQWAQDALADELLVAYDHRTPRAVDYVIGACQIIRDKAYAQVGALDEKIFYGPEDVDYCIRMWRRGWRVMYVPDAVVVHAEQRATKQRVLTKLALAHARGLGYYFWKHRYLFTRPSLANS